MPVDRDTGAVGVPAGSGFEKGGVKEGARETCTMRVRTGVRNQGLVLISAPPVEMPRRRQFGLWLCDSSAAPRDLGLLHRQPPPPHTHTHTRRCVQLACATAVARCAVGDLWVWR